MYRGKIVRVTEEVIDDHKWERVYIMEGVHLLPFDDDGNLWLILEKRPHEVPPKRWKVVAGCVDKPLSLEHIAQEELREELGMRARSLIHYMDAGEKGTVVVTRHYYIASDLVSDPKKNPDSTIVLDRRSIPFREVYNKVMRGEFGQGNTAYVIIRLYNDLKNKDIIIPGLEQVEW